MNGNQHRTPSTRLLLLTAGAPLPLQAIGGRRKLPAERVADDHVFFWKAIVAEPCYWDAKSLLTGAELRIPLCTEIPFDHACAWTCRAGGLCAARHES